LNVLRTSINILSVFTLLIIGTTVNAQENHLSSSKGESSLGLGVGLPYGGIGIKIGTNLADHFNLFGGIGYQIAGVGYNVGFLKDFKSESSTQFYLTGMYGTNAVILVDGLSEYDKVYTGATMGLGIKINSRKTEGNFWDVGLLVPIRSSSFYNNSNEVKNDPRVTEFSDPWPVLITFGYNIHL